MTTRYCDPRAGTVVVTGVGGPAGRSLAYQLTGLGFTVIGIDMDPNAQRWFGSDVMFHVAPVCSSPAYLPMVRQIADRYQASAIIPTVSEELGLMAAAGDSRIAVASQHAVAVADDKWLTYLALTAADVPSPRSTVRRVIDDHEAALLGTPFLIKPRVARGGRGVRILDAYDGTPIELHPTEIAQEFAPGIEYGPNLYIADDPADDVVVVLAKEGLAHGRHGNATGVRIVQDRAVGQCAQAAARALGLHGAVDVDVRLRADGTPVVLEINARFGANSAYAPEVLQRVLASFGLVPQEVLT